MASASLLWITSFSPQRWLRPSYYATLNLCGRVRGWIYSHPCSVLWLGGQTSQLLGIGKSHLAKFWSSENWENSVWKILICWIRRNPKQLFVAHCLMYLTCIPLQCIDFVKPSPSKMNAFLEKFLGLKGKWHIHQLVLHFNYVQCNCNKSSIA